MRRRAPRPRRAARSTARRSRSSPPTPTGARGDPPRRRPRDGRRRCSSSGPGTKVTIGPPIENGFYYDFEFPDGVTVTEADLRADRGARCAAHIEADEPFERRDIPVAEAIERFRAEEQPYKVELIEDLVRDEGVETVSLYRNGPFEDLCRGPHGPSTGRIKAFKLNSLAGAYWRGDETPPDADPDLRHRLLLRRRTSSEHLERIEQAKARDHRRLGPQLGLFMLREEAPGMPFWLPARAPCCCA